MLIALAFNVIYKGNRGNCGQSVKDLRNHALYITNDTLNACKGFGGYLSPPA